MLLIECIYHWNEVAGSSRSRALVILLLFFLLLSLLVLQLLLRQTNGFLFLFDQYSQCLDSFRNHTLQYVCGKNLAFVTTYNEEILLYFGSSIVPRHILRVFCLLSQSLSGLIDLCLNIVLNLIQIRFVVDVGVKILGESSSKMETD